jgi:hypothetical protein
VLNTALGTTENFANDAPPNSRAIEVGASRVQNGGVAYALRIFGRPPRTTACDCERAMDPALPQKLFTMADATVVAKLQKGRVQQLLATKKTDEQVLEELFLATLSRFPTEVDRKTFADYQAKAADPKGKNRQAVFVDTLWALINTEEFILNH